MVKFSNRWNLFIIQFAQFCANKQFFEFLYKNNYLFIVVRLCDAVIICQVFANIWYSLFVMIGYVLGTYSMAVHCLRNFREPLTILRPQIRNSQLSSLCLPPAKLFLKYS